MAPRKRILFIAPLPPPVHGSAVVSEQIRTSEYIRSHFDCDFVNLSTSRKMDEIGKGSPAKVVRFLSSYFKTFGLLLTRKYDLCYLAIACHGNAFLKDAPFVLLCKLFGRRIVIHQHNKGMQYDVERRPYKWLLPLVYRNTTVMLLSWLLYPDIEKVVARSQVKICPNGIPDCAVEPNRAANVVPQVIFLSNLIESKGVIVLLDALSYLKDKGCSFSCVFVGSTTVDIDEQRFNSEVEKRGLEPFVTYKGRMYGDDKNRVLSESDVLVFPTYYNNETFGLVLLEAMQNSLPVVTTDEGGIPDVVVDGEYGFICKRKDPVSLSESLQKLLEDKDLRVRMGEKGRVAYLKSFTVEAFEKRFVDIINSVLEGN